MLLGLLDAGVITDPSHAGYLGGELTKAETALRLGLHYDQDLPLRAPRASVGGVRPVRARKETRAISEARKNQLSLAEFLSAVVNGLGHRARNSTRTCRWASSCPWTPPA
ncbi:DUF4346 domain-containing protein [Streptomyces sp. INA 01156]